METLNTIDGERGIPNVNNDIAVRWRRGALVTLALISGTGFAAFAVAKYKTIQNPPVSVQPLMTKASTVPARKFEFTPEPEKEPEERLPVVAPAMPFQPIVVQAAPTKTVYRPAPRPVVDKSASGALVASQYQSVSGQGVQVAQVSGSDAGLFGGVGGSELSQALTPTKMDGVAAARLPHMQNMLTRGQTIDCALTTRIVTSVAGLTSCTVTRDIYSTDGANILLASGSRVTGEYQSNTRQGSRRIFVLWSRVQTPSGVIVDLNSPGTDALGSSGIPGNVDSHFWERFGGALLLSLVDDIAKAVTDNDTTSADVVIGGTANVGSELAAEVLRNTINIPPTIYTHQGARISIFVARDVDFSSVMP